MDPSKNEMRSQHFNMFRLGYWRGICPRCSIWKTFLMPRFATSHTPAAMQLEASTSAGATPWV